MATCSVISIGIILRLVSWQCHFKGSIAYSPLHSCVWWYIRSTCWCAASEVDPQASTFTECHSSSRVFFLLSASRRSRIFSPTCNMSFLSYDSNEKILSRFRNPLFFKSFCNTVRDPTKCNLDVVSQPQKVCISRFDCVSSSPSNCVDFLISTAVSLELGYKCTGW